MAQDANLRWDVVDSVLIGYATAGKVTDAVWGQWVEALKTARVTGVLNISAGHTEVSSVQRASASAVLKARNLTVAVVTDETLLRGMVTAVSWFVGNNIRSFSGAQLVEAIEFLHASRSEDRILRKVAELRSKGHS